MLFESLLSGVGFGLAEGEGENWVWDKPRGLDHPSQPRQKPGKPSAIPRAVAQLEEPNLRSIKAPGLARHLGKCFAVLSLINK